MDAVLETRPDLAARIIQLDSSLTMYRDGRGNPAQLTQPRVEKLPNSDLYTVTVRRPDGVRVPFTQMLQTNQRSRRYFYKVRNQESDD